MSIQGYVPSKKPVAHFDFVNGEYKGGPIYGFSSVDATHVNMNGEVRPVNYQARNSILNNYYGSGHRIDYDPFTGECKGLLLERTSTNLLSQHNVHGAGLYAQVDQGLTIVGPDGNVNSAREYLMRSDIAAAGGSTGIAATGNLGVTSGACSWSIFLKVTRSNYITFKFYDNNNNIYSSQFRIYNVYGNQYFADVEIINSGNSGTVSTERYRGGWVRVKWENFSGSQNSSSYLQLYADQHAVSNGSNVGYAMWGHQFENLPYATSPILTTGSSITRNRDTFQWFGNQQQKNSMSFYDVFNKSSEFTIFTDVEYTTDQAAVGVSSNAGFDFWHDSNYKFSHRRSGSLLNYNNIVYMNVAPTGVYERREKIVTSVRDYKTFRSKNGFLYKPISTQGNLSAQLETGYGNKYRWSRLDGRVDSADVFCHNGHVKTISIWNCALSEKEIQELSRI